MLIVGGGLIGSSIAWRLAQKGVQVTIADAGTLGGEASPAGAGMLAPGSEFDRPSIWAELAAESMKLYPSFVEEVQADSGRNVDFQICGAVVAEQPERVYPGDGIVDPGALLGALRCACEARKVRVVRERIGAIESSDYAAVVVAAGAWSDQIQVAHRGQPVPLPRCAPIKGHLIGFQLQPGLLGPVRRRAETYVLQRSSGFLIAGSNEQDIGFEPTVDGAICDDIHRRAAQLFPTLENAKPVKRWIGFRPRIAGPNGDAPCIGRVEGTNVWLAYGHYRNGILLTPVTAARIADDFDGAT